MNIGRFGAGGRRRNPILNTASADPYVQNLLVKISEGKRVLHLQKADKVFSQGDAIFLIQNGKVKVTVASPQGKKPL